MRCCDRGVDQPVRIVSECQYSCAGEVMFEEVSEQVNTPPIFTIRVRRLHSGSRPCMFRIRAQAMYSDNSKGVSARKSDNFNRNFGPSLESDIVSIHGLRNNDKAVRTFRLSTTAYPGNDRTDVEEIDREDNHGSRSRSRNPKP
jgi:hypothetical protein